MSHTVTFCTTTSKVLASDPLLIVLSILSISRAPLLLVPCICHSSLSPFLPPSLHPFLTHTSTLFISHSPCPSPSLHDLIFPIFAFLVRCVFTSIRAYQLRSCPHSARASNHPPRFTLYIVGTFLHLALLYFFPFLLPSATSRICIPPQLGSSSPSFSPSLLISFATILAILAYYHLFELSSINAAIQLSVRPVFPPLPASFSSILFLLPPPFHPRLRPWLLRSPSQRKLGPSGSQPRKNGGRNPPKKSWPESAHQSNFVTWRRFLAKKLWPKSAHHIFQKPKSCAEKCSNPAPKNGHDRGRNLSTDRGRKWSNLLPENSQIYHQKMPKSAPKKWIPFAAESLPRFLCQVKLQYGNQNITNFVRTNPQMQAKPVFQRCEKHSDPSPPRQQNLQIVKYNAFQYFQCRI